MAPGFCLAMYFKQHGKLFGIGGAGNEEIGIFLGIGGHIGKGVGRVEDLVAVLDFRSQGLGHAGALTPHDLGFVLGIKAFESGDAHIVLIFPVLPEILQFLAVDAPGLIGHVHGIFHGILPVDPGEGKPAGKRMHRAQGVGLLGLGQI